MSYRLTLRKNVLGETEVAYQPKGESHFRRLIVNSDLEELLKAIVDLSLNVNEDNNKEAAES